MKNRFDYLQIYCYTKKCYSPGLSDMSSIRSCITVNDAVLK